MHIRVTSPWIAVLLLAVGVGCGGTPNVSSAPRPAQSASSESPAVATPVVTTPSPSIAAPSPTTPAPITLLGRLPTTSVGATTGRKLQAALEQIVAEGAPDAIGAVVTANGTWTGAAGFDGPKGRRATAADMFGIASVSKPILAASIMRLAEEGKIDLDAPLANYLPGLRVNANGATVRQALWMKSGMGASSQAVIDRLYADCAHIWTRDELLEAAPAPFGPPGERYEYSNPTYRLLGFAAEEAAGRSLAEAIRTTVLEPAGVSRILLQGTRHPTPKPWALPIEGNGGAMELAKFGVGGTLPCLSASTASQGAAGMASDAESVAHWGWQLFAGRVIDVASLGQMTSVDRDGYGLGIDRLYEFSPDVAFGHTGSQPGYAALLVVLPERQISVAVFVNEEQADVARDANLLIAALQP